MKATSSCVRTLAHCTTHPAARGTKSPSDSIESTIKTVLDYQPIADALVESLFVCASEQLSSGDSAVCLQTVRQIAFMLSSRSLSSSAMARALVLMHIGTSQETLDDEEDEEEGEGERSTLVENTTTALKTVVDNNGEQREAFRETISNFVSEQASCDKYSEKEISISESIHSAALSLIISFGNVACNYSPLSDDPEDDENIQGPSWSTRF